MVTTAKVPILGFVAYSGTGKTTLLLKLLPLLKAKHLQIGMVKHTHHNFEIDQPGKDSYRLRKAGADHMLLASRYRWALMVENEGETDEPRLDHVLPHLIQEKLDLILVEGFKHEHFPKIEIHRPSLGHPLLFPEDSSIIAVATDLPHAISTELPVFNMNHPDEIVKFMLEYLKLKI